MLLYHCMCVRFSREILTIVDEWIFRWSVALLARFCCVIEPEQKCTSFEKDA